MTWNKHHCKNFKSVSTFFKVHTTDCGMLWSHVELVTYTQLILGLISLLLQSSRRKLSSLQQQISFALDLDNLVLQNNGLKSFFKWHFFKLLFLCIHTRWDISSILDFQGFLKISWKGYVFESKKLLQIWFHPILFYEDKLFFKE